MLRKRNVSQALRVFCRMFLLCTAILLLNCTGGNDASVSADNSLVRTAILTWDPVTAVDLAAYRVYYGTASGTYLQPPGQGINVGTATTHSFTTLNGPGRYFFVVTSYYASGIESNYSNEVYKEFR